MQTHAQMFYLLCVRGLSQSLYSTIHSNQSVTFSSTPAGTRATLSALDFSQEQKDFLDYKVVLPRGADIHTTSMGFVFTHFRVDHSN